MYGLAPTVYLLYQTLPPGCIYVYGLFEGAVLVTLTLALKGEYFDAIKAGTKPEEYRLLTP